MREQLEVSRAVARAVSLCRPKVIAAFQMLETKRDTNPRKKHGNIPL